MRVTIAINCRSDKRLTWTLDNIARVTDANDRPDVLVVFDGNQKRPDLSSWPFVRTIQTGRSARGTSYARHLGIMNAKHESVITCDSHIDFIDDALDQMVQAAKEMPYSIICGTCRMIVDGKPKNNAEGGLRGANLYEFLEGEPGCPTARVKGERVGIASKWRISDEPGVVDCVMGGCYGLTRRTYIDVGQPWQYGRGWGGDEESAAIAWAACGYQCMNINAVIAHVYQEVPSYKLPKHFIENVWYNRYRVAAMACNKDKAKLMDMVAFMGSYCGEDIHHYAMQAIPDVTPWLEYMEQRSGKFHDKPKPIERKERVESVVVVDKGIPCRKCKAAYSMRITHTWPNGNRRGVCKRCGNIHTIIRPE